MRSEHLQSSAAAKWRGWRQKSASRLHEANRDFFCTKRRDLQTLVKANFDALTRLLIIGLLTVTVRNCRVQKRPEVFVVEGANKKACGF